VTHSYAKASKRVNIQRLKIDIWSNLSSQLPVEAEPVSSTLKFVFVVFTKFGVRTEERRTTFSCLICSYYYLIVIYTDHASSSPTSAAIVFSRSHHRDCRRGWWRAAAGRDLAVLLHLPPASRQRTCKLFCWCRCFCLSCAVSELFHRILAPRFLFISLCVCWLCFIVQGLRIEDREDMSDLVISMDQK